MIGDVNRMVDNNGTPDIETTGTRVVYQNNWMRVREDAIRRRDGSAGIYGVVEKDDFVVVVPVEADGSVHLVQQYRYPVRARFWERRPRWLRWGTSTRAMAT